MKIRGNRKLKFIALILFFAFTVIITSFMAVPIHELGHYMVASSRSSENVAVTYDISLMSLRGWCECGNMNETDTIISRFSGGLFSGGLFGLLWLLAFGFERNLHHMNLNFALIFVSIKEIAVGVIEGIATIFGVYEWYHIPVYISNVIILIILIYKYRGTLVRWLADRQIIIRGWKEGN